MKPILRIAALAAPLAGMIGIANANHSWSTYHWARTSHPMALQVIDSVTNDWQYEFETALNEWNQSTALNMSVTSSDESSKTRRRCQLTQGQIRVCNQSYGFNGWLGLATISIDPQGHIDAGSAQMNDSYSSYWADPNEKRHVMCQEIGHDFGLGHTSTNGSSQNTCMDYSNSPTSISPNQHDYDQILVQHHTNPYDDYNSYLVGGGGGGGGGGCNAPPGVGCNKFGDFINAPGGVPAGAIRVDHNKFEEVWIKGRGDGGLLIFHIRLAPKENGK